MVALPPTFADLRALVRGELVGDDRATVASWLVVYADENTAAALDALAVEWREVQHDRRLPQAVAEVSAAFWPVFEAGLADIDPDPSPARVDLLRAGPAAEAAISTAIPRVELIDGPGRVVRVSAPLGRQVIASNDRGEVVPLRTDDDYRCELAEGRVTFWALARTPADGRELLAFVHEGLTQGRVSAVRITDEFFDY